MGDVYTLYQRWAFDNGHQPMAKQTLSKRLKERGLDCGERRSFQHEGRSTQQRVLMHFISRDAQRVRYPGTEL